MQIPQYYIESQYKKHTHTAKCYNIHNSLREQKTIFILWKQRTHKMIFFFQL